MGHLWGDFSDEVVAEIEELEPSDAIDVLYFGDFVMGEIEDLQMQCGGDVRGYAAYLIMAEVELTDALRGVEIGDFLDPGLRPSPGLLPCEVIEHNYLKNNAHFIIQNMHYVHRVYR